MDARGDDCIEIEAGYPRQRRFRFDDHKVIERISSRKSSGSRELFERFKIVIVGGLERGNVGISSRARSSKIGATPREALAAKLYNQNIGRHTGPAAVSVW
jgi:hypothetical protein